MKFKDILFLNLFILIFINSKENYLKKLKIDNDYDWTIVGAGPAGIIIAAVLLELGISEKSIFWIDPDFKVGRLGEFYSSVPANSNVASIIKFMQMCKVISEINTPSIQNLNNMNPLDFPKLQAMVDPLQDITDIFLKKVNFNAVLHNKNSVSDIYSFFKRQFGRTPLIGELDTTGIKESQKKTFWKTYFNDKGNIMFKAGIFLPLIAILLFILKNYKNIFLKLNI